MKMYNFNLWIDDEAYDKDKPIRHAPAGFLVATNSKEAIDLVQQKGLPAFIDFDHDLGMFNEQKDTAMAFLRWLENTFDFSETLPPDYSVHSQNSNGRDNIISFMESWHKIYWMTQERKNK